MAGLGSIGTQHVRNLTSVFDEECINYQIDALRLRGGAIADDDVNALISESYSSADKLPSDYDIIFINTPTSLHYAHIEMLIDNAKHMFIEKPVFDCTDYAWQALPWQPGNIYYVACPLRYNSVIKQIAKIVKSERIYSARSICSSYLPEWRIGTDYRECYSARKEQGGGVQMDLIHEWDYLCYLFGRPSDVKMLCGKYSDLDINSDDLAVYVAEYFDKLISLHLDYFGRVRRRELELYTEKDIIIADLYANTITYMKQDKIFSYPQSRAEIQKAELKAFLSMVNGELVNHNTIADAVATLSIAIGEYK